MFATDDSFELRVKKIEHILAQDPTIAFNLAFLLFNWTIKRIILASSKTPSIILKENLKKIIDPPSLKALWKKELSDPYEAPSISKVITNWELIKKAYLINERMQLGQCTNCEDEISAVVFAIIRTCEDLNEFCKRNRIQIYDKIPSKNFRYVKVI